MIMRDKEEVAKLIREVFDAYCKSFDDSLNRLKIWPWTDKKTVIHESNQIHRFLDAYQKTGSNIVTWMELPVYQKNGALEPKVTHIDAFIVDDDRKLIFFIEAKRFSRPSQVESLKKDIYRLFKLSHEIYVGNGNFRGINLFDYDAYMIPLADVWDYRSKWCKEFADNWERESYDLEGIYTYRLATMKKAWQSPECKKMGNIIFWPLYFLCLIPKNTTKRLREHAISPAPLQVRPYLCGQMMFDSKHCWRASIKK